MPLYCILLQVVGPLDRHNGFCIRYSAPCFGSGDAEDWSRGAFCAECKSRICLAQSIVRLEAVAVEGNQSERYGGGKKGVT